MTGLSIAVAFLLLLWCSLLYLPFRWRPAGIYLAVEKGLAVGYISTCSGPGGRRRHGWPFTPSSGSLR